MCGGAIRTERVTNIRVEGTEDVDLRGVNALFTFKHDQEYMYVLHTPFLHTFHTNWQDSIGLNWIWRDSTGLDGVWRNSTGFNWIDRLMGFDEIWQDSTWFKVDLRGINTLFTFEVLLYLSNMYSFFIFFILWNMFHEFFRQWPNSPLVQPQGLDPFGVYKNIESYLIDWY